MDDDAQILFEPLKLRDTYVTTKTKHPSLDFTIFSIVDIVITIIT
jgi:hypothetical protein